MFIYVFIYLYIFLYEKFFPGRASGLKFFVTIFTTYIYTNYLKNLTYYLK